MSDTTSLNTGKKAIVNGVVDHFNTEVGYDIQSLECMFRVNEIYFDHVVTFVEGMKKRPEVMQSGTVLNYISKLDKPNTETLVPRDQLKIRDKNH